MNEKLYRIHADGNGWVSSIVEIPGEGYVSLDEIFDDEWLLESYLDAIVGDPGRFLRRISEDRSKALEDQGFTKLPFEYETGLREGSDDDPSKLAAWLRDRGIDRFFFAINSTDMFGSRFSLWVDREEWDNLANDEAGSAETVPLGKYDISPAESAKAFLRGLT